MADRIPHGIFVRFKPAECDLCLSNSICLGHSPAHELLGGAPEMEAQLSVHLGFELLAFDYPLPPGANLRQCAHISSGVVFRMPTMTAAKRVHLSVSAC